MSYDIVIRGGTLVSSTGKHRADLGIRGEKVAAVGLDLEGRETIDATGKLVLPGAIDVHDHFKLPFCGTISADDFITGTRAAACGGVTSFIDFAIPGKGVACWDAVNARRAEADPDVCIDYGLHPAITSWDDHRAEEMKTLIEAGYPTFKMFMIYKGQGWQANDADLYRALREARKHGGMVGVHAENDDLIALLQAEIEGQTFPGCYAHAVSRPTITESEAIARAIAIAAATDARLYIFHMSTGEGARIVRGSRKAGIKVCAETGPHYLLLDDEKFKRPDGHHWGTCPPIRKPADQERLWAGLADGSISILATDNCTFNSEQKKMWGGDFRKIPFGMPGIETMMPLTYAYGVLPGRITVEKMVEVCSENPARIMGMWPQKGTLQAGADADVVIFDPEIRFPVTPANLHHNCDYTPFEGFEAHGWPQHVLLRGKKIVWDRQFLGKPGDGRFIARKPQE